MCDSISRLFLIEVQNIVSEFVFFLRDQIVVVFICCFADVCYLLTIASFFNIYLPTI